MGTIRLMKIARHCSFLLSLALSACATSTFRISAAEQQRAEEAEIMAEMSDFQADGLAGTWILNAYDVATCRWSRTEPGIADCQTRYHRGDRHWYSIQQKYRRDHDGDWEQVPADQR